MTAFLSLLLALLPLLGIVGMVWVYGVSITVDNLFLALILLAIAATFAGNALFELRKRRTTPASGRASKSAASAAMTSLGGGFRRGRVEQVEFFESHVGQPNKSIVMLADGASSPETLVLEGDVRNALPVGRKVEITFRKESGRNVLVEVRYA